MPQSLSPRDRAFPPGYCKVTRFAFVLFLGLLQNFSWCICASSFGLLQTFSSCDFASSFSLYVYVFFPDCCKCLSLCWRAFNRAATKRVFPVCCKVPCCVCVLFLGSVQSLSMCMCDFSGQLQSLSSCVYAFFFGLLDAKFLTVCVCFLSGCC